MDLPPKRRLVERRCSACRRPTPERRLRLERRFPTIDGGVCNEALVDSWPGRSQGSFGPRRATASAASVFDVSGAGDTVTAWVGTALAAGASVCDVAQVANYAAGVEVGKAGVATVSPREVLAMHEAHHDQLGKLRRRGLL